MTRVKKALPRKPPKEDKPKKAKPKGAEKKKVGSGNKPRYSYPAERFGKDAPAPMEPVEMAQSGQIPTPPPRVPEPLPVDPRKFAAQMGLKVDTLVDIASRFERNPGLGGQDGFSRFMCAKLREMFEKHGLDGDYAGRLYDSLLQLAS